VAPLLTFLSSTSLRVDQSVVFRRRARMPACRFTAGALVRRWRRVEDDDPRGWAASVNVDESLVHRWIRRRQTHRFGVPALWPRARPRAGPGPPSPPYSPTPPPSHFWIRSVPEPDVIGRCAGPLFSWTSRAAARDMHPEARFPDGLSPLFSGGCSGITWSTARVPARTRARCITAAWKASHASVTCDRRSARRIGSQLRLVPALPVLVVCIRRRPIWLRTRRVAGSSPAARSASGKCRDQQAGDFRLDLGFLKGNRLARVHRTRHLSELRAGRPVLSTVDIELECQLEMKASATSNERRG